MPDDAKSPGENGSEPDPKVLAEENARLKTESADKAARLDEVNKQLLSPDYLEYLASKRRGEDDDDRPKRRGKSEEDEDAALAPAKDIEDMSQKELAEFIIKHLRKDFSKVGEVFDGELDKLHTAVADVKTAMEIDRVAGKYPDFWEYKQDILVLSKKNPHLTPLEAYKQVKYDKLEKADVEHRAADEKAKRRVNTEKPGGVASASARGSKPIGFESAFNEAYKVATGSED